MQKLLKPYYILFAILTVIIVIGFFLSGDKLALLVLQEQSLVEIPSTIGYFITVAYMFYKGGLEYFKKYFYIPLFLLFLGLREMDFNARFTDMGILKSRFFISNDIPILQKIIAGLILLFILATIILLIKNHSASFLKGLFKRDIVAIGIFLTLGFLVLARILDGLDSTLEIFGIYVSIQMSDRFTIIEEVIELGIPFLALITSYYFFKYHWPKRANIN